ncbi:MAG: ATP-binding protein [Chitinispirillia bacterium]|jgi:signal transduction histidine kinase
MDKKNISSWRSLLGSRPAIKGLLIGFLIGIFDFLLSYSMGVRIELEGNDIQFWVTFYFTISFACFTWIIGALIENRHRLIKVQEELIESETLATVGRLAAGVAHEVRNPLTTIRSSVNFVLEDLEKKSESYRACQFVIEEVDRLNVYIKRLLNFSKPLAPIRQSITAEYLVSESLKLVEHPKEVEIKISKPSTPIKVLADTNLLIPVMVGLVKNAVEAVSGDGSIIVKIYRKKQELVIDIIDSGPGLPEEVKQKLFEPFVTTKADGTGLGIAMARKVIQSHNGSLSFYEKSSDFVDGKGTCARITFPITDNNT